MLKEEDEERKLIKKNENERTDSNSHIETNGAVCRTMLPLYILGITSIRKTKKVKDAIEKVKIEMLQSSTRKKDIIQA